MNILIIIIGVIVGWLVADLAFIQGTEPRGKFKKIFVKFLKPKDWKWMIGYVLTTLISVLIFYYAYIKLTATTDAAGILFAIIGAVVGLVILHASVVDISCYQIVTTPVLIPLVAVFIINGALALGGYENNVIAGTVAAVFMFLVITLTKKKGMGEGDLLIFILMGLSLGLGKLIVSFYIMILTGSIFGIIVAIRHKRIKGIKMPFVPFMLIGYLVAMLFGDAIVSAYLSFFYLV